jgi:hypothetical protein
MKNISILIVLTAIVSCLTGCYTDTVDAVATFEMQLPVHLTFNFQDKQAPDTTIDRVNLLDYAVYRDNQEDIKRATAYQISYWIDSLSGDPGLDDAEFDVIDFYIRFAGRTEEHLIARYENVKASEYYRKPHIYVLPDSTIDIITEAFKHSPDFTVTQRYGRATTGTGEYELIVGKVDVAVRLEVEL